jgi:hypothetical protein
LTTSPMSTQTTAADEPRPNPLRVIRAFLAQKVRLLTAAGDEGGLFECRFLGRLVERLGAALGLARTQSLALEQGIAALDEEIRRETAPDDDTPGILDARELARLRRRLRALGHEATTHTAHLSTISPE